MSSFVLMEGMRAPRTGSVLRNLLLSSRREPASTRFTVGGTTVKDPECLAGIFGGKRQVLKRDGRENEVCNRRHRMDPNGCAVQVTRIGIDRRSGRIVARHFCRRPRTRAENRLLPTQPTTTTLMSLPVDVLEHIVDVHCHPTDSEITADDMERLPIKLCTMATRQSDQELVANLARALPNKIIPCFGPSSICHLTDCRLPSTYLFWLLQATILGFPTGYLFLIKLPRKRRTTDPSCFALQKDRNQLVKIRWKRSRSCCRHYHIQYLCTTVW